MLFQVAVTVQSILKFYTAFAPIFDGFLIFLLLFLIFNFALSSVSKPQTTGGVIGGLLGGHGKENHSKAISAILALMITIPAIARGYSLLVFWDKGWIPSFIALMVAFLLFGYLRSKHQGMNFWLQFGICAVVAFVIFHAPLGFTSFDLGPFWGLLVVIGGIAGVYWALHLRGVSAPVAAAQTRSAAASAAASAASDAQKAVQSIPADVDKVINALRNTESATDDEDYTKKAKFAISAIDDILKSENIPLKKVGAIYDNAIKLLTSSDIDEELRAGETWRAGVETYSETFETNKKNELAAASDAALKSLRESGANAKTQLSHLSEAVGSELPVLKQFVEEAKPIFNTLRVMSNELKTSASKTYLRNYVRTLESLKNLCISFGMHEGNLKEVLLGLKLISDNWVKAAKEFETTQNGINKEIRQLTPAPLVTPEPAKRRILRSGKSEQKATAMETISFVIQDDASGSPISNAAITIDGESESTDAQGRCEFVLSRGAHDLEIGATDYDVFKQTVRIRQSDTIVYGLSRSSKPLPSVKSAPEAPAFQRVKAPAGSTVIKGPIKTSAEVPRAPESSSRFYNELTSLRVLIGYLKSVESAVIYRSEQGQYVDPKYDSAVKDFLSKIRQLGSDLNPFLRQFGFKDLNGEFNPVFLRFNEDDQKVVCRVVLVLSDVDHTFTNPFSARYRAVYDAISVKISDFPEVIEDLNALTSSDFTDDAEYLTSLEKTLSSLKKNLNLVNGLLGDDNYAVFKLLFDKLDKSFNGYLDDELDLDKFKSVLEEFKASEWARLLLDPTASVPGVSAVTRVRTAVDNIVDKLLGKKPKVQEEIPDEIKKVYFALDTIGPEVFDNMAGIWKNSIEGSMQTLRNVNNAELLRKYLGKEYTSYFEQFSDVAKTMASMSSRSAKEKSKLLNPLNAALVIFKTSDWPGRLLSGYKVANRVRMGSTSVKLPDDYDIASSLEKLTPAVLHMPFWDTDLTNSFKVIMKSKKRLEEVLKKDYTQFKSEFDEVFNLFMNIKRSSDPKKEGLNDALNIALSQFSAGDWVGKFNITTGPVKTEKRATSDGISLSLGLFDSLDVLYDKLTKDSLAHFKAQVDRLSGLFSNVVADAYPPQVRDLVDRLEQLEKSVKTLDAAVSQSQSASEAKIAYYNFRKDKRDIKLLLETIRDSQ